METHEPDPTDPGSDDPWNAVSSQFGSLGEHLKDTYRKVADGRGPSDDEIQGAFATLVGAWGQVAESLSSALRDPETRDHLKRAASSFATAMGATFSQFGEEMTSPRATDEEE